MLSLKGQTTLITGGAQGIGLGIARELVRAGSRVILADKDILRARAAAAEINAIGGEAVALELDVTSESSVQGCTDEAIRRFGTIDVLVNNAGLQCERVGALSTVDHFIKCLDVNLLGVWRMTQSLAPHFRQQRRGKVINIASIDGRRPATHTPAYSASKAAVISLTQSLATTLAADDINVNAVCPGGIMTAMADWFKEDRPELERDLILARPLKRPLLVEDIGWAVVFLASSLARSITGQALNVDGGTIMS